MDPIDFSNTGNSRYNKRMAQYLKELNDTIPKSEGIGVDTKIGAGVGIAKALTGIVGMFTDAPQIDSKYKPSYVQDPNLKGAANAAMSKVFSNNDDYASRIRLRNQRIGQTLSAIGNSGGDRNFVAANEGAARDIENVGNLSVDKQLQEQQTNNLNAASNLQQMALYDRLNESRDELNAAELNFGVDKYNQEQKSKHIQGATSLITSGVNDIAGAAGNEIQNDAHSNLQRLQIANVMAKYFMNDGQDNNDFNIVSPIDGYIGTTAKNNQIDPNVIVPEVPEGNDVETKLDDFIKSEQDKYNRMPGEKYKGSFLETSVKKPIIKRKPFGSQYSPKDYSF